MITARPIAFPQQHGSDGNLGGDIESDSGHRPDGLVRRGLVDVGHDEFHARIRNRVDLLERALRGVRVAGTQYLVPSGLPEAEERETWGVATFRVREKIYAMGGVSDGRSRVSCKARPGLQAVLVQSDPARFFVPPYVGPKGWVGIYLDDGTDWDEVADLIEESYRMTAPKRVAWDFSRASSPSTPSMTR